MSTGKCPVMHHGMAKARGCSHAAVGHFNRLFPNLKPLEATKAEADTIARYLGGREGLMDGGRFASGDSALPAGYIFFAQFVDHDITLDTQSDLHAETARNLLTDPLPNLRSPTLDLDCVYGMGPEAHPHLYEGAGQFGKLVVGTASGEACAERPGTDLQRNARGTALIGDPRNDENLFVSQMQLLFIQLHNAVYDRIGAIFSDAGERFEATQTMVRWHYQKVVVEDFLQRICDPAIYAYVQDEVKKHLAGETSAFPHFYRPEMCSKTASGSDDKLRDQRLKEFPMPVEFSVAAYRFGHTLVRDAYPVNAAHGSVQLFDEGFGTEGFSAVPCNLVVDWRYLLPMDTEAIEPARAKQFDPLLASELIRMPDPIVGSGATDDERSLAFRNIRRSFALGLPSGQDVVKALRDAGYPNMGGTAYRRTLDLEGLELDHGLDKKTPLFFYLLREAQTHGEGERLGPAGSAILLEVFLGTMLHCSDAYLFRNQPEKLPAHIRALTEHYPAMRQVPHRNLTRGMTDGQLELADLAAYVRAYERVVA